MRQNELTTERHYTISFCRVFVLWRWPRRQDTQTERHNKVCFRRLFVLSRSTTRRNDEMEYYFVVWSFSRLHTAPRNDKTTKLLQHIKAWFVVVTCSFCRFVDFHKAPNDGTTTRQNDLLQQFCIVVCLFCRVIQVVKTTKTTTK